MKKLIAVSAVAALAATALSAEITFGIWGRALWNVAANGYDSKDDSDQIVTDIHQSWGGNAPRIGLTVAADTENYGFNFQIFNNGTDQGQGDNAYVYCKPIEQVKIFVGKMDVNLLQGDACFGLWDWDRLGCVAGEKLIFKDYLDADGFGTTIVATPVAGLTLGAALPLECGHESGVSKDGKHTLPGVLAHYAAYVGAYDIEGVGTIKAALKMLPKVKDDSQSEVAAAFELKAVENLFAAVGTRINTNSDAHDKEINLYARYGVNEQLTVHALAGTKLSAVYTNKDGVKKDDGLGFMAGVGVDYNLENGIALFADVRYANGIYYGVGYWGKDDDGNDVFKRAPSDADNSDNLTLGLGVAKNFSNGSIGIAFEGSTNNGGRYTLKVNDKDAADKFSWEVPVRFQYSF